MPGEFGLQAKALRKASQEWYQKAKAVDEKIVPFNNEARVESNAFGEFGEADEALAEYHAGVEAYIDRLKLYRDVFEGVGKQLEDSALSYEKADRESTM